MRDGLLRDKHFIQVYHPAAGLAIRYTVEDESIEPHRVIQDAVIRATDVAIGPAALFVEPGNHLLPSLVGDAAECVRSYLVRRILNPDVKEMFGAIPIHPRDDPGRLAGKRDGWSCQEDYKIVANCGETIAQPT